MAYLGYEQVNVASSVLSSSNFNIPEEGVTHVELQAFTNHVRYLVDDDLNPAENHGMKLLTTEPPKLFLIEDFKSMKFNRDSGGNGELGVHYIGGRSI